jgi:hypothetical protein
LARIRTVKPSYFSDAKVCKLSVEAELLFVGMWCFTDCEGYLWDDPDQLQLLVFPSRPHIKVAALIEELLLSGMVAAYQTILGRDALWIRKFTEHQRIKNEPASTIAPLITDPSGQIRTSPEPSGNVPQEGKGRERKGKEKSPSGGGASPSAPAGPSQALVTYYIGECKVRGYEPDETLRGQLASKVKRLLTEKPQDLIESAIRVIADERKSPAVLSLVIADLEAGRSANANPA